MKVELVIPHKTSKPRSRMFPVLVFLLMACYGVMALVVVEQGNVIQSQRNLIVQLFQDGKQLTALKSQEATQRAIEKQHAKANGKGKSSISAPAPIHKEQPQKQLSRKSRVEKQPLQADDKIDRRRYPSQI